MYSAIQTLRTTVKKTTLFTMILYLFLVTSQTVFAVENNVEDDAEDTKSSGGMVEQSDMSSSNDSKATKNSSQRSQRLSQQSSQQRALTSWIDNAEFEYLLDNDGDGYYHRFRVTFDADTDRSSHRIYAKLYLDNNTEERLYYTTADFTIVGTALYDQYEVTTSLTSGYDSDVYNLRIAIFDANTNELLDTISGYDDNSLNNRYLEQVDYDAQQSAVFTLQELSITLTGDYDQDGFFPQLEITLDADVSFGSEWVTLSVFIIDPAGNENRLYGTEDFLITGYQTADKDINTVSLETGYSPGLYHIRAELRDANNGLLLATTDTLRSSGLAIESEDYDDYSQDSYGADSEGHAGALGIFAMISLFIAAGIRRRKTS